MSFDLVNLRFEKRNIHNFKRVSVSPLKKYVHARFCFFALDTPLESWNLSY